jgi:hypothetical protein
LTERGRPKHALKQLESVALTIGAFVEKPVGANGAARSPHALGGSFRSLPNTLLLSGPENDALDLSTDPTEDASHDRATRAPGNRPGEDGQRGSDHGPARGA